MVPNPWVISASLNFFLVVLSFEFLHSCVLLPTITLSMVLNLGVANASLIFPYTYKFPIFSFMRVHLIVNINVFKSLSHKCILDFSCAFMGFKFFHSCVLAICNQCQLLWVLKSKMHHWFFLCAFMMRSKLFDRLKCEFEVKIMEEQRVGAHSLTCNTLGGRGACWSFGMGLGKMTST
jgi:hypothetical protein